MEKKLMMSLFAAGTLACSLCGADAPAAKKAAPAPAAKPAAAADLWAALPEVVASVDGKNITRKDVEAFLKSQMPDGKIPPMFNAELLKQMAPGIVRGMVEQQLMDKAMAKSDIKASADMVAAELKKEIAAMPKEQLEMLKKSLEMQGSSIDKKIKEMSENVQMQKQMAYKMFLDKSVFASVKPVTEAEAKAFYDKNLNQFKHDEQISTSHILFKVDGKDAAADKAALDKAIAAFQKLEKDPSQFEAIAKTDSACPSKAEGGKLPPFPKGKGQMVKEFEDAAAAIGTKGKIVGPVKTQFGYHLIRLDEVVPAGTDSFDTVKANIMSYLTSQRQQEAFQAYMKKLTEDNKVKFMIEMPQQ